VHSGVTVIALFLLFLMFGKKRASLCALGLRAAFVTAGVGSAAAEY
jgi:hypothetical protein